MNYLIQRITNNGGKILDHRTGDGIAAVLMESATGTVRILTYDPDEAQHEGAECVIEIRAFASAKMEQAKAAFRETKL